MEFCIEIKPDENLKKIVDNFRYHYDRKLIKEKYPYLIVFGPVKGFINMITLTKELNRMVKKMKRFKLTADVVGYQESEKNIFLNIYHKGQMKEIYNFFINHLDLKENPYYFPHITLARNHTLEELQSIYEELKNYRINHNFAISNISIKIKESKHWDTYLSINI